MTNREMGRELYRAFESATPDVWDRIQERTDEPPTALGRRMHIIQGQVIKRTALIAASILVIAGVMLSLLAMITGGELAAVTVDTYGAVKMSLSRSSRPLSIVAGDRAGSAILDGYGNRSDTPQQAIDSLLAYMIKTGTLCDEDNTVLLTIEGDEDAEDELHGTLLDAALGCFSAERFDGAVLVHIATDDEDVRRLSEHHGISVGKAQMIADILDALPSERASMLAGLSINDLNLIACSVELSFTDITVVGTSSESGRIGADDAVRAALSDAGLQEARGIRVRYGADDSGLVYVVTFENGGRVYEYRVTADTGEVLGTRTSDGGGVTTTHDVSAATAATSPTVSGISSTEQARVIEYITATAATAADTPAVQQPIQPAAPDSTVLPAPAETAAAEPAIFSASSYLRVTDTSGAPPTLSDIAFCRISSGYDTFYDADSYPYAGEMCAAVFNTRQLYSLLGVTGGYTDAYFASHALLILMECEDNLHWARGIATIGISGDTLYVGETERVGVFSSQNSGGVVNTLVYELDRSDLSSVREAVKYTKE